MNTVYLVANGDLRLSANQKCEPAQAAMETALVGAIKREGLKVKRAHRLDETKGQGLFESKKASRRRARLKKLWSEQLNAKVSTSSERIRSMKRRVTASSIVRRWDC